MTRSTIVAIAGIGTGLLLIAAAVGDGESPDTLALFRKRAAWTCKAYGDGNADGSGGNNPYMAGVTVATNAPDSIDDILRDQPEYPLTTIASIEFARPASSPGARIAVFDVVYTDRKGKRQRAKLEWMAERAFDYGAPPNAIDVLFEGFCNNNRVDMVTPTNTHGYTSSDVTVPGKLPSTKVIGPNRYGNPTVSFSGSAYTSAAKTWTVQSDRLNR